jgi:hypothetical protein
MSALVAGGLLELGTDDLSVSARQPDRITGKRADTDTGLTHGPLGTTAVACRMARGVALSRLDRLFWTGG